jgi:hypothetical protein
MINKGCCSGDRTRTQKKLSFSPLSKNCITILLIYLHHLINSNTLQTSPKQLPPKTTSQESFVNSMKEVG